MGRAVGSGRKPGRPSALEKSGPRVALWGRASGQHASRPPAAPRQRAPGSVPGRALRRRPRRTAGARRRASSVCAAGRSRAGWAAPSSPSAAPTSPRAACPRPAAGAAPCLSSARPGRRSGTLLALLRLPSRGAGRVLRVSVLIRAERAEEQSPLAASLSPRPGGPRTGISLQRPRPSALVGFSSDNSPSGGAETQNLRVPDTEGLLRAPSSSPPYWGESELWMPAGDGFCDPASLLPCWRS